MGETTTLGSLQGLGLGQAVSADAYTNGLPLSLIVRDREVIDELVGHAHNGGMNDYALTALRLGVLAMRQASGSVDAQAVQKQADALLSRVERLVSDNATTVITRLTGALTEYFDPATGKLTDRLARLISKDGELSTLLTGHLHGDGSTVARTLALHIGAESPLMKLLSPEQKEGLLNRLHGCVEEAMTAQAREIGRMFSLDEPDSCLSRTVGQLVGANGQLRKDLAEDLRKVQAEFSLDNPTGALARLVKQVTDAKNAMLLEFSADNEGSAMTRLNRRLAETNEKIRGSLTLDDPKSPLAVLKAEVQRQVQDLTDQNQKFHAEVRETLAALQARKKESERGTQQGVEFEQQVSQQLRRMLNPAGDAVEDTGMLPGILPRCKTGDNVITLSADSFAADARIVVESKQFAGYTERRAIDEIAEARRNREAQFGIFVFSRKTAPDGQPPMKRVKDDVLCVWDAEDPSTDVILEAAISVAKALVVRRRAVEARDSDALNQIDADVIALEKAVEQLDQLTTWITTIGNNAKNIYKVAETLKTDLASRAKRLAEYVRNMRQEAGST